MIRQAKVTDWHKLQPMLRDACAELEQFGEPNAFELLNLAIYSGIAQGQTVLVAEGEDDELIGYVAWLKRPVGPEGEIIGAGTYVKPEHRKRGVADKLRAAAEERCRRYGGRYVVGTATVGNEAGLESVLRRGFRVVGHVVRKDFAEVR